MLRLCAAQPTLARDLCDYLDGRKIVRLASRLDAQATFSRLDAVLPASLDDLAPLRESKRQPSQVGVQGQPEPDFQVETGERALTMPPNADQATLYRKLRNQSLSTEMEARLLQLRKVVARPVLELFSKH